LSQIVSPVKNDTILANDRYFREALSRRADYGEAANNLALVLVSQARRMRRSAC
jgi:hypothetical protein